MSAYPVVAVCAVSAAFLLFITAALRNKGDGSICSARTAAAAVLSFPVCTALGLVFAKLFYVLLMEAGHIMEWGEWDALFSLRPDTFCLTGGGVGVWLGLLLSAAFVIIVSMLNNKVQGEGDLKQADLAILGVIPYYELEG